MKFDRTPDPEHDVVDRGSSLPEIIVSILLIGIAVVAMLTTMAAATNSSSLDRDHVNAHAWLQSAADVLYGYDRQDCGDINTNRVAQLKTTYGAFVRANSTNPQGWPAANLDVTDVKFWDGESSYQATCYDDSGINLQLITLQVRAPDGRIIESVQIVKG